jgi:hypothetical protein
MHDRDPKRGTLKMRKNWGNKAAQIAVGITITWSTMLTFANAQQTKMNSRVPPVAFCDQTVFTINGKALDFDDVLLDGNRAIEYNKQGAIEAYAYLDEIHVANDPFGTSYANMYKGTECYLFPGNRMITPLFESPIQVIFNPQRSSIPENQYREIRRTLIKAQQSGSAGALVKISGSFDLLRDNFKLFFNGTAAQIIDVK